MPGIRGPALDLALPGAPDWSENSCRILIDIGDVLIETRPTLRTEALTRAGVPEPALARIRDSLAYEFDAGKLTEDAFLDELSPMATSDVAREELRTAWGQLVGAANVPLIDALRSESDSLIVSNTNPIDWSRAKRALNGLGYSPPGVVSFAHGVCKPEKAFFALAHAVAQQHDPLTLLFIDDQPANVSAAKAFGFRTHLHTETQATIAAIDAHRRHSLP